MWFFKVRNFCQGRSLLLLAPVVKNTTRSNPSIATCRYFKLPSRIYLEKMRKSTRTLKTVRLPFKTSIGLFHTTTLGYKSISGLWTNILLRTFYRKIAFRKCNGQFYPSGVIVITYEVTGMDRSRVTFKKFSYLQFRSLLEKIFHYVAI